MLKKIFCMFIVGLFILTGCSNNIESDKKVAKKVDKVLKVTSDYDYAYDLSNNKELCDHHDNIALIEITDVEGSSNYNDKLNIYVDIFTYGNAVVKEVYKGNLKKDDKIAFTRLGGEIEFDQWKKGLNERQLNRLKDDEVYTTVVSKSENDIDIEKNKTYLVFLDHTSSQKENEYAITGFAYGMREVENSDHLTNRDDIRVKNNVSGEYESLQKVVVVE